MTKTIALRKTSKYVPFQRFYYTHIVSMCINIRWTINIKTKNKTILKI